MPEAGTDVAFRAITPAASTVAERLADVLTESFREDTSTEFRLGLLQGALQIAMPELMTQAAGGRDGEGQQGQQ